MKAKFKSNQFFVTVALIVCDANTVLAQSSTAVVAELPKNLARTDILQLDLLGVPYTPIKWLRMPHSKLKVTFNAFSSLPDRMKETLQSSTFEDERTLAEFGPYLMNAMGKMASEQLQDKSNVLDHIGRNAGLVDNKAFFEITRKAADHLHNDPIFKEESKKDTGAFHNSKILERDLKKAGIPIDGKVMVLFNIKTNEGKGGCPLHMVIVQVGEKLYAQVHIDTFENGKWHALDEVALGIFMRHMPVVSTIWKGKKWPNPGRIRDRLAARQIPTFYDSNRRPKMAKRSVPYARNALR